MNIETALRLQLIAAGVTTPIHPTRAPQEATLPYIVYAVATEIDHDLQGASGLAFSNITYTVHAESYPAASAIAASIETSLDALAGAVQGCNIGVVLHQRTADAVDELDASPVTTVEFRVIWYPSNTPPPPTFNFSDNDNSSLTALL